MKTFVLTGPESTGKSWLSGLLAGYFETSWRPEYLREFYDSNDGIEKDEMFLVAQRQIQQEKELLKLDLPFVFFDTNIISLKIYHQFYFQEEPQWFKTLYEPELYSHYFLLDIDVPWVQDEQRDSPAVREKLFHQFQEELEELELPYSLISGSYIERRNQIKAEVENYGFLTKK